MATRKKWAVRTVSVVAGVIVGLVVAELAFAARDEGAYPHLNVYAPDEALGVVLAAGEDTRVAFGGNAPSDVHINTLGFRGGELGAPTDEEILVLGDSQAFGLGVNDGETVAAQLAELTGRPVINAGVPTYGPLEYVAAARRAFETRSPGTVVVIINAANDFFEHSRPNIERHAVWDGWAVRAETAPHDVFEFPGRGYLYGRSHAFLALRRAMHSVDDTVEGVRDTGFASEGTLRDLVHGGEAAEEHHAHADRAHREELAAHRARLAGLEADSTGNEDRLDEIIEGDLQEIAERIEYPEEPEDDPFLQVRAARGHPGDIIGEFDEGESSRSVAVTARLLGRGVRLRQRLLSRRARRDDGVEVRGLLERRDALEAALVAERGYGVGEVATDSVLAPRLAELSELAEEHGAELLVVALPLDIMVSEAEFAKYDHAPVDVSHAGILLSDLVSNTERLGARGLDATDALSAAEPGAFLDRDLHMSAKGHRALAEAIAGRLETPAPLRHPAAGLPEGRSAVPAPEEFVGIRELVVVGSTAAGCATHLVREWLRVSCRAKPDETPTGVELTSGGRGEALVVATETAATLLAPVLEGDSLAAKFHFSDRSHELTLTWPEGAETPDATIGAALAPERPEAETDAAAARLCACHVEVHGWTDCEQESDSWTRDGCGKSCQELYGAASSECLAAYQDECAGLLRCVRGDPERLPPCRDGEVNALGTGRCHALCSDDMPCQEGSCVPWQGTAVCAGEGAHRSENLPSDDVIASASVDREGALPTSAAPTVGTFGGDTCRAELVGDGIEGYQPTFLMTPSGPIVLARGAAPLVRAFDTAGAPRGEARALSPPTDGRRWPTVMALLATRLGTQNVVFHAHRCDAGNCIGGRRIDDEGADVGEPFETIEVGFGSNLGLVVADEEGNESLVVAFGTTRAPLRIERWSLDETGSLVRALLREHESGSPNAVASDAEHFAATYRIGPERRLVVDDGPTQVLPSDVNDRAHPLLELEGDRAEITYEHAAQNEYWQNVLDRDARRDMRVVSELPRVASFAEGERIDHELPEGRLDLDLPLSLHASGLRIHRSLEDGTVAAHPVRVPAYGALVWADDHLLVIGYRVHAVRCW